MKTVKLKTGKSIPALGMGTWHMGESGRARGEEVAALRLGLDLGMRLIDTAEMYGDGGAEEVVGEAIAGRRDEVYLVSKVYPHNASAKGAVEACERSLRRLKTDRVDLYLLHWRGSYSLAETAGAFERLKAAGKIGAWGVSNLDLGDMREMAGIAQGAACVSNQVLYHLGSRGIEWDLLAYCQNAGVMVMAYSPLGQGSLLKTAALRTIAAKHGVDASAIALAWVLRQSGVVAIPKATRLEHVRANARAGNLELQAEDIKALDAAFPPPTRAQPLQML